MGKLKSQFILVTLTILICLTLNYSLQGRWSVNQQYITNNAKVSFTFDRSIQNNNSRIVYYMNVFACKLIRYKYLIVDNQIYITFVDFVADRSECKINQINYLRNKIQSVFYFYIVGRELTLLGPDDKPVFRMQRTPVKYPEDLAGQWVTVDAGGKVITEPISATQQSFKLCDGKGLVLYDIQSEQQAQIQFTVSKTAGCSQNDIYSALHKTVYYRWKSYILLYFYDENFEQIMTIRKIDSQVIIPDNLVAPSNSNISTPSTTNNSSSNNETKTANTTANNAINNTTNNINSNIKQNTQSQNTSTTTSPSSSSTQQQVKITGEQFLGKWLIKSSNYDYTSNGYFFLILANRIMLYGGCNVYYSSYQLKDNGALNNIDVINTKKDCPVLQGEFSKLVEQFKQVKSVSLFKQNNKKNLSVKDKNSSNLFSLQKIQ